MKRPRLKKNKPTEEEGFIAIALAFVLIMILMIVMVLIIGSTGDGFGGSADYGEAGEEFPDPSGPIGNLPPVPGNCLIWSNKVESSFIPTMRAGSARLGLDPNWVMAIMAVETVSSFRPCIRNPYSNATGLIQFMPKTALSLGTNIDRLCGMSQTQQWRYVEEYLRRAIRANGRPRDLGSAYMLVFTPIYTQSPSSKVMYRHDGGACRIGGRMRKTAYCQNQVYDYAPKDGLITKFEASEAVRKRFKLGYASCRVGKR